MLYTSGLEKEMKKRIYRNGYHYVNDDMKVEIIKNELKNSISEYLSLSENAKYQLDDLIILLEKDSMNQGYGNTVCSSYTQCLLNLMGDLQGNYIIWNQKSQVHFDECKFKYSDCGYVNELVTPNNVKASTVLSYVVNNMGVKHDNKLLIK